MSSEELSKLAEECKKDDPNTAIVLFVLAGAKYQMTDGQFAAYCQQFARAAIHGIKYDEWIEKG